MEDFNKWPKVAWPEGREAGFKPRCSGSMVSALNHHFVLS